MRGAPTVSDTEVTVGGGDTQESEEEESAFGEAVNVLVICCVLLDNVSKLSITYEAVV